MNIHTARRQWPAEGLTRVPYWLYHDPKIYELEQERVFKGPTWSLIGLEAEIPAPGDFRTTVIGDLPVSVRVSSRTCPPVTMPSTFFEPGHSRLALL